MSDILLPHTFLTERVCIAELPQFLCAPFLLCSLGYSEQPIDSDVNVKKLSLIDKQRQSMQ